MLSGHGSKLARLSADRFDSESERTDGAANTAYETLRNRSHSFVDSSAVKTPIDKSTMYCTYKG